MCVEFYNIYKLYRIDMKKIILAISVAILSGFAMQMSAQESKETSDFKRRYELLVSRLGATGVGIETLIENWEAAHPDDIDMLVAKFSFLYSKSQSTQIVPKDADKFLGEKPLLTLNDSTGKPVKYFQETFFDDVVFGEAQKALDKAIQSAPDRLDLRFLKVASFIAYEKESPDMALSDLKGLIDYNGSQKPSWVFPGEDKVNDEFFSAAIQEYCVLFFRYATPASYEAFRDLSQRMLAHQPSNVLFLDNMGSYYLVAAKDNKTATKYYNKVLKIKPDDMTAIKNMILMARNSKNEKLEKKYLPMMIKYSQLESERLSAKARLEYIK